jgi:predicted GTPase
VKGKRVLVVEDGPTITHGGMPHGAGYVAAVAAGADVVDPRPSAAPGIREVFEAYRHIGKVLPAVGYDAAQLAALRSTINGADADVVVSATPADLSHLLGLDKKVVRARYEFAELDEPKLSSIVDTFVARTMRAGSGR